MFNTHLLVVWAFVEPFSLDEEFNCDASFSDDNITIAYTHMIKQSFRVSFSEQVTG